MFRILAALLATAPSGSLSVAQTFSEEYEALTNNRVEVTNFNPEPFTGLVFDASGGIWAVNPYGSTINFYDAGSLPALFPADPQAPPTPAARVIPTGLNPVSVGTLGTPSGLKVIAVCAGTHGAFLHDALTGNVEGYVQLESEPADLVIDEDNDWAFVSCQGTNRVLVLDMDPASGQFFEVIDRIDLTCGQRPGPLYLDPGDAGGADNAVYVAQTVTGNNSIFVAPGSLGAGRVLDLDGEPQGLPDVDVFRIRQDGGGFVAEEWIRGVGSLLFDLARSPVGDGGADRGDLWILSSQSLNKDPARDSEHEIRGDFVVNSLVLVDDDDGLPTPLEPAAGDIVDLDDHQPGVPGSQYTSARSINQARTIDFVTAGSQTGAAFLASPFVDNIVFAFPSGVRLGLIPYTLPAGAQCYDLRVYEQDQTYLLALCLGSMTIEVFNRTTGENGRLDLGLDPTPTQLRAGRDVFLDGSLSQDARFSCASCHPRGMTDQLGWSLQDDPIDVKDVMLTQSLMSIADTFPHHWRGERDLKDFQKAFRGLLGAAQAPPDEDMDDLIAFFQSLQAPANPYQSLTRKLDPAAGSPLPQSLLDSFTTVDLAALYAASSPARGQEIFDNPSNTELGIEPNVVTASTFDGLSCAGCHIAESGSNGNFVFETAGTVPRALNLEVPHFRQLQNRGLEVAAVDFDDPFNPGTSVSGDVNQNGFGMAHDGQFPSLYHFVFNATPVRNFPDDVKLDLVRFIDQFDQGIAPAAHYGARLTSSTLVQSSAVLPGQTLQDEIESILLPGADGRELDLVLIGRYDPDLAAGSAPLVPMRWVYNNYAPQDYRKFLPEDPGLAKVQWVTMRWLIENDYVEGVLLGVPPGNGVRFGVDHDNDGVWNAAEAGQQTDPWDPDSNDDGTPDGYTAGETVAPTLVDYELDFQTARMAKYHVRFSEDVKYVVRYGIGTLDHTFERDYYSREDTFVLTHSSPSYASAGPVAFDVQVELTDRSGNAATYSLGSFEPDPANNQEPGFPSVAVDFLHVSDLQLSGPTPGANGGLEYEVTVTVNNNDFLSPGFGLEAGAVVLANVYAENLSVQPGEAFFEPIPESDVILTAGSATSSFTFGGQQVEDYIVSDLTDSNGETRIRFELLGMQPGRDLRFVVQGLGTPPGGSAPFVLTVNDLAQMTMLGLEDASELSFEAP